MSKSSWALVLMICLLLVLTPTKTVFSQDVGYIKKAQGDIYWREKDEDPEVKVKARDLTNRPLVRGESFRCGRNGILVLIINGEEVTIREKRGWYPIPHAKPTDRNPKNSIEQRLGAGAGITASNDSLRTVPENEQIKKLKGVVTKRGPDSFLMADTTGGPEMMVVLTENTEVKSHKKGVFRGSKEYGASYLLRGLRIEVDGVGNADGAIVADKIRFDEQDLRAAQALKSTVDPVEAEMREKMRQQQQEQERLAGQIAETQAMAAQAQAAADKAQQTADYANNRINGLDDFDPIKTITVTFAANSATLGPKAKATIDEAAAWVKTQNTKGWVMAVVGYADTTGNTQRNIDLSERRANAVIYYIVSKYKMPLNRLVQPFGYGQLEPVAENKTREGRAKNRRVEIRLMVNRGIAGTVEKGN